MTIADLFDLAIATLNLSKSVNAFLALCLAIFCPHLDAANSAAAPLCAAAYPLCLTLRPTATPTPTPMPDP